MAHWSSCLVLGAACLIAAAGKASAETPIDTLKIEAAFSRGGDYFAFGFDALWFMSGPKLFRIDAGDNSITETMIEGAKGEVRSVAFSKDAVWLADTGSQKIFKIDPRTRSALLDIYADMYGREGTIGVGDGSVWVVTENNRLLTRFNEATGEIEATVPLPSDISTVAFAEGAAWAAGFGKGEIYRIDSATNTVTDRIPVLPRPRAIIGCEGGIWVFGQGTSAIERIDPKTRRVVATVSTGHDSGWGELGCGGGYLWFSLPGQPLGQIDPATNTLVRLPSSREGCSASIAFGAGSLWLGGAPLLRVAPPQPAAR
jgi:streptogramin lyase